MFLGCPTGWDLLKSNCYKVFAATSPSWKYAENQCQGEGGHLASIHSKEENDFVSGLDSDVMWLGGTDLPTEGTWIWSDGSTFSFTSWNCGNPDNAGTLQEHCMTINQRCGGEYGWWNDLSCSSFIRKFVCKIPTTTGNLRSLLSNSSLVKAKLRLKLTLFSPCQNNKNKNPHQKYTSRIYCRTLNPTRQNMT